MLKHVDKPCSMDGAWVLLYNLKCERILFLEKYKRHSAPSVDTMCIMCKSMYSKNA